VSVVVIVTERRPTNHVPRPGTTRST
jgi:hypothetical protein